MKQPTLTAEFEELAHLYCMPDKQRVENYLAAHSELVSVLIEARPHLEKQFGRNVVVELRIPVDYETGSSDDLFAMAMTRLDPYTALERMNGFWDDWWADEADRHRDYPLHFDVDYAGDDETEP